MLESGGAQLVQWTTYDCAKGRVGAVGKGPGPYLELVTWNRKNCR